MMRVKKTVKTLSNIRFSLLVVQMSDKYHDVHSLQNGHISMLSAFFPHIKTLKVFFKSKFNLSGYNGCFFLQKKYFESSDVGSKPPKRKNTVPNTAIGNNQIV
jgi:hypothetical protein